MVVQSRLHEPCSAYYFASLLCVTKVSSSFVPSSHQLLTTPLDLINFVLRLLLAKTNVFDCSRHQRFVSVAFKRRVYIFLLTYRYIWWRHVWESCHVVYLDDSPEVCVCMCVLRSILLTPYSLIVFKLSLTSSTAAELAAKPRSLDKHHYNVSLWSPYGIRQTIIFSSCGSFLSIYLFFPRLISAAAHWMSTILPHMVWA